MTHAVGTEMAHGPILRPSLYFSLFTGEVKQGAVKVSGLVLAHASFALRVLAGVQRINTTQHNTGMKRAAPRSAGPPGVLR